VLELLQKALGQASKVLACLNNANWTPQSCNETDIYTICHNIKTNLSSHTISMCKCSHNRSSIAIMLKIYKSTMRTTSDDKKSSVLCNYKMHNKWLIGQEWFLQGPTNRQQWLHGRVIQHGLNISIPRTFMCQFSSEQTNTYITITERRIIVAIIVQSNMNSFFRWISTANIAQSNIYKTIPGQCIIT
jgi:hypothetical protein